MACSDAVWRSIHTSYGGNIALTKRSYFKGAVIAENKAFSWVLRSHLWSERCSVCFLSQSESRPLLRCGSCKTLCYCSASCQKKDWKLHHKHECQRIQGWSNAAEGELLDNIVLLGRTIRLMQHQQQQLQQLQEVECMCSMSSPPSVALTHPIITCSANHVSNLSSGTLYDDEVLHGIETACKLLGLAVPEVAQLYLKFRCNNFGILNELLQCVGAGVFPLAAALTHSCRPNCFLRYRFSAQGPSVQV